MAGLKSRGLASHLVGRAVLEAAARALAPHDILLMPLKGIWLQQLVYADPSERVITDVDVLVRERDYAAAIDVLRDAGWSIVGRNRTETALRSEAWPLPLDLHQSLFSRSSFAMPAAALFERGSLDDQAFAAEVVLPSPYDVFAHLVGHFVKSRGGRDTAANELHDLPAIAARFSLEPRATARHLEQCGLARAARYALQCVAAASDRAGFCPQTLAALRRDPVGQLCAASMLAVRSSAVLAALPGFVLEPTLPRGALAAALRAWDRGTDEP